jgi:hypothetical protein
MNLTDHIIRQMDFSANAFGPGSRFNGVRDHILKELVEIEEGNNDPKEWVDVWLLSMDGLWRSFRSDPAFDDNTDREIATIITEMVEARTPFVDQIETIRRHVRMGMEPANYPDRWVVLLMAARGCLQAAIGGPDASEKADAMIEAKQTKNEARVWPDGRNAEPDKAIQHVKGIED